MSSYTSLVDGLRKAPSSFAELTYYSQFAYRLTSKDGKQLAVRFRLIPCQRDGHCIDGFVESGMLSANEQEQPWNNKRRDNETRSKDYLRQEYIDRLRQDEPVCYQLQIQSKDDINDPLVWHPQQVNIFVKLLFLKECIFQSFMC
jgi:arachidonate 5-lipoxygenase